MKEKLSKYKETFLTEGKEHIEAMSGFLLKLEKSPSNLEFVSKMFREVHTLKSMAGTMGYDNVEHLCHVLEDVLDARKEKKIKLEKCIDTMFECFDTLSLILRRLKEEKEEPDITRLLAKLQRLSVAEDVDDATAEVADKISTENPLAGEVGSQEKVESINVKVERLNSLMKLAEELLINQMSLVRFKEKFKDRQLASSVDMLGRLVNEIQFHVMQSRLVPIEFVFNRFPRMVRDLAKAQEKQVNLEMAGTDIELDRSVIDEIGDSLVHLLRNAIDHGIETSQARKKAGKSPQATIKLEARRDKNFVVIEVTDDGAGLDIEEIRNTALKKKIISPGATKEEVMNSIFSDVSTTKKVTAVSGRGFGLNIVKNKIESLGGSINVFSERKEGTTFIMEIPLTLAVIKALFIEVGDKSYAIPVANIERLVTFNKKEIQGMMNYEVIILDDEDIHITRLDTLFNAPSLSLEQQPIAIIRKGEEKVGLAVDKFLSSQDIVVKPLNKVVKENKYFSGTTIIGSGEAVLILDTSNLMLTKRENLLESEVGA